MADSDGSLTIQDAVGTNKSAMPFTDKWTIYFMTLNSTVPSD